MGSAYPVKLRNARNSWRSGFRATMGTSWRLTAGLSAVKGNLVFVLDADLQDPPELLADFVKTMKQASADVVYGQRLSRAGESWFKSWTAHLFYRVLAQSAKTAIPVDTGDFV